MTAIPLSRKVIAAYTCWSACRTDSDRRAIVLYACLGERDIAALDHLCANVAAAGDPEFWFESQIDGNHARLESAQQLLAGLELAHADLGRFAVALCLETPGRAFLLEAAFEKLMGKPRRRCDAYLGMKTRTKEGSEATVARVEHWLATMKIDVSGRVDKEMRLMVAQAANTSEHIVEMVLAKVRKAARKQVEG